MDLAMIGLGRMGANMTERLVGKGHTVTGYARHWESVKRVIDKGAKGARSLEELTSRLSTPRIIWMMIPAGKPVDDTIEKLVPLLDKDDILIDGGNSFYRDTQRRASFLGKRKIHYIDSGTSGGVWGLTEGYSLMLGGEEKTISFLRPLFEALAPAPKRGWGRVGPSGAGHFVKMVHNAVEYGLMQAYGEGFSLLEKKKEFVLDLHRVAEIWRYGSVIRSWLLDLTSEALAENPNMAGVSSYVEDSGQGRWAVKESLDLDAAAPVITLSLLQRISSREEQNYGLKLLAVLRHKFGGHEIKTKETD